MRDLRGRTTAPSGVANGKTFPLIGRFAKLPRVPVVALVVAGLCSATAISEGPLRSSLSAMVQSASDLIAQRSPGIRTRAIMGKGKMKGAQPTRFARALPRVREARGIEAPPLIAGAAALPGFAALPDDAGAVAAPAGFLAPAAVPVPDGGGAFLFPPVGGPGFGGGGPGGGIVIVRPPGEEEPGPPLVPPPAIPEPATWTMMLFGFGALGYTLRRKTHGQLINA